MEKVRIYELAKELNTTSKRLIEKLAEIDISVKNHMSFIEKHEVDALYKHIGVISHDGEKKGDDLKDISSFTPHTRTEQKTHDKKDIPRIIRTTEITSSTSLSDKQKEKSDSFKDKDNNKYRDNENRRRSSSHQGTKSKNGYRSGKSYGGVKVSVASSGLRAGFVRETDSISIAQQILSKKSSVTQRDEEIKKSADKDNKNVIDSKDIQTDAAEAKANIKQETKTEQKTENKIDIMSSKKQNEIDENLKTESVEKAGVEFSNIADTEEQNVANKKKQAEVETENKTEVKEKVKKKDKAEVKTQTKAKAKSKTKTKSKTEGKDEVKSDGISDDKSSHAVETQKESNAILEEKVSVEHDNEKTTDVEKSKADVVKEKEIKAKEDIEDKAKVGIEDQEKEASKTQSKIQKVDDAKLDAGSDIKDMRKDDNTEVKPDDKNSHYKDMSKQHSNVSRKRSRHSKNAIARNVERKDTHTDGNVHSTKSAGGFAGKGANDLKTLSEDILIPDIEEEIHADENKREYQNKDINKDIKREHKRDIPRSKNVSAAKKRFKPHNIILDPTIGVSKILQEDELLIDDLLETSKNTVKRAKKSSKVKKEKNSTSNIRNEDTRTAAEKSVLTSIKIGDTITVKELAEKLKKTAADIIKKLMMMGTMVTLNQEIDFDVAAIVADEYGVKVEKEVVINEEDILFDEDDDDKDGAVPRPPVVVVMGHVDHGKTSLLDAIRKTNVIESEEGGITQHIGAYTVKVNDRNITFLDTPGHEAFTAMRARGAQVTDIAILVVAADDGVMPQTVEAINHARAAGVTVIVAINKIDKPSANSERVKQQLTEYGLVPEEWGGDITVVPVSAKKRENIDLLLEMVLLTADIMELKANPDKQAKGTVIEAKLDKNRGPIATLLVQRGTLHVGDSIITGTILGRIRAMTDDKGQNIKTAGPSTPVEILGLPEVPESGELFYVVKDEKLAKSLAEKRKQQQREEHLKSNSMVSLEDLFSQIQEGQVKDLNVIIKADVQGSVEAVKQSIEKLSHEEVKINVIHGGVGAITETDVKLAEVSNAIIIGFNVRPGPNVNEVAEAARVEIKLYRVIYEAINDIEAAIKGMLEPTLKEVIHGHAEIRQIYKASGVGTIGGAYVLDGKISRNSSVRIVRDSIVIHEGKLASLKRFKDDVREVAQGYECGIVIERFNDIKEGDIVEAYAMEEVAR